jgi:hypothetical protein
MEIIRTEGELQEKPVWHTPVIQRLVIGQQTLGVTQKDGSTEDLFSKVDNWPNGVPFPET